MQPSPKKTSAGSTTATECSFGRSLRGHISYKIADHNGGSGAPSFRDML